MTFVFGQPIFMEIGYTNCSAPGWKGYSPKCTGCEFDAKEAAFAKAVGRLWTSYAATGDPNARDRVSAAEEHADATAPTAVASGTNVPP